MHSVRSCSDTFRSDEPCLAPASEPVCFLWQAWPISSNTTYNRMIFITNQRFYTLRLFRPIITRFKYNRQHGLYCSSLISSLCINTLKS